MRRRRVINRRDIGRRTKFRADKESTPSTSNALVVKAEGGRVRRTRRKIDVNKKIKQELLTSVSEGTSLHKSLREAGIKYSRYYQWLSKDLDFKRDMALAREGRSTVLHEKFYEKNVAPIAEESYHEMDNMEIEDAIDRNKAIASAQNILTSFKKEDAPQLYNKDNLNLNVDQSATFNFNIDTKQLERVVGSFRPKVVEGEVISVKDAE